MSTSEVANLRMNIETELVALRQGLYGLAYGVSRHDFIQTRMNRLGTLSDHLATHIGTEQAIMFSYETYARIVEGPRE